MVKLCHVTTFLFFVVLMTISPPVNSSNNISVIANPRTVKVPLVVILTDVVLKDICYQTGDPSLCHLILNHFRGKTLFPKPLANVMDIVKGHARSTSKKIWGIYDGIKDQKKIKVKGRYRKCMNNYISARNHLRKAEKFMVAGKIRMTRLHTSLASADVRSCDQELARHFREPLGIAKDNKKFNNLCSIVFAICGVLKRNFMLG
ncbi:PREDICTED: uncharacterized protein LOC105977026 [Erythranthe guttata]|uniref:uncharacterized protein LOC105977026 n=1 Tax=Erythranthe guttata TaxID=4155 RepID=UPI00064E11F3|nr:PREDICTED: uncharacterized protein LOC105977026 [Erythranthe guttata]|eukprot:XP_012857739.1 PREDICTED: uncharacterized protein LOC105977026 [Erythranthe guttata]